MTIFNKSTSPLAWLQSILKKDLTVFRKNSALTREPSLDFASYPDGLHPDKELAYCWLKKIVTQIFYNLKLLCGSCSCHLCLLVAY